MKKFLRYILIILIAFCLNFSNKTIFASENNEYSLQVERGEYSDEILDYIRNNWENFFGRDELKKFLGSDIIEERAIEKRDEYLERFSDRDVKVYTDYKKMLEEVDIDMCSISTESGYHGEIALYCLEQSKHVLIEKPMAMSLEEIDKINKLADEKGLKVGVCHQNRFNPPIQKLKKTIDANKFGKMTNITARVLWNRNQNYYNLAPWRGTKALDGGTLMNQCIHALDLLLWMMDDELVSVKAETETFLRDITTSLEIGRAHV